MIDCNMHIVISWLPFHFENEIFKSVNVNIYASIITQTEEKISNISSRQVNIFLDEIYS